MRHRAIASVFFFLLPLGPLLAEDWNDWRGPERTGISKETGLARSWPEDGPPLVWTRTGLGKGFSSVSVANGVVVTLGTQGNNEVLFAVDEKTGRALWAVEHGPAFRNGQGDGPRGTPTIHGDRVYALGAHGILSVHDIKTGEIDWFTNVISDFKGRVPRWGVSESPLITEDLIVLNAGGRGAGLVALDRATGEVRWQGEGDGVGYSSPIAIDFEGRRQVIFFTDRRGLGVDLESGEALWEYKKASNGTANAATPIHHDGKVYFSSDYGTGGGLVQLSSSGAEEVYFNGRMRNHHSTSVLVGDHLYGFSGSVLTALDFDTGEVAWRERSVGKGSLVSADCLLFLYSERGVVGLAEADPKEYRELSRFRLPDRSSDPTWAYPAIANGRLYLRAGDRLYAYDVQEKGTDSGP